MRIAILASGRFHVCDLARELSSRGHDVAFWSLVPPWRTAQFGLPARCNRWLLPLLGPLYAAKEWTRGSLQQDLDGVLAAALDEVASRLIGPCDVFIGMSGLSLRTMQVVKRKYGARVLIERGSRHILSQREILESLPGGDGRVPPVPEWAIRRSLEEYDLADRVVVPALHVLRSFTERGFPESRLLRNPYGVDLDMFPATRASSQQPSALMVGAWCRRKGCDTLTETFGRLDGDRLVHVGPIGDATLPAAGWFEHRAPVDQKRLTLEYAASSVFVLPSREEGLALVIPQALASGLPVVCSDRTGGEDLKSLVIDPRAVTVVPPEEPELLAEAIRSALAFAAEQTDVRDLLREARSELSWSAYGKRYHEALQML